ncbi:MAG: PorP/SprF family type IX secretion system membrane protein [Chitinophagaceae bacterium]|nr:PorP/SprF family type IX secretion system membrane protein [Chitinophagaceae bacterium]
MKIIAPLTILMLLCFTAKVNAQDPHFSQFFASPLTLNPALTGKFDGNLRVAGNYRNQWPALNNVYTTYTVSVDFRIMKNHIPSNDTWGVGILALKDQAGGNILTDNYVALSTSYHKALDEDGFQQIGIGFQGSYGQKRLDQSKLYFEDMLTPFGFTGITQEVFNNQNLNVSYLDLNAGILYSGSTSDDNNFYVGASMYHINRPRESFMAADWSIGTRATVHAGGFFPVADNVRFHASGIFQVQNKATETVIGGAFAAAIDQQSENPSNVYFGSWFRFNDALIPYVGLEFSGMRIGATYDINISSLRPASQSRGGMELSLIYVKRPSEGGRGIPCPVF